MQRDGKTAWKKKLRERERDEKDEKETQI